MTKEVIATDIDEVLFPFVSEFTKWHNARYGSQLRANDFHSYEFDQVLGLGVAEVVERVHGFLEEEELHLEVSPLQDSQDALYQLSDKYDLVAITARHPKFESTTSGYLRYHFGEIIKHIALVGHVETVDVCVPKLEVCRSMGAIALVDDSLHHLRGCDEYKVSGILFGQYPWNSSLVVPQEIKRINDWPELVRYLMDDEQ